jgi:hypothetical protein
VIDYRQYAGYDACHDHRHDQGKQPMGVPGMKFHIAKSYQTRTGYRKGRPCSGNGT